MPHNSDGVEDVNSHNTSLATFHHSAAHQMAADAIPFHMKKGTHPPLLHQAINRA
jgi:hypothetical protein